MYESLLGFAALGAEPEGELRKKGSIPGSLFGQIWQYGSKTHHWVSVEAALQLICSRQQVHLVLVITASPSESNYQRRVAFTPTNLRSGGSPGQDVREAIS